MTLAAQIEAVLFFLAEPVSVKRLAVLLGKSENEINEALNELEKNLISRGIVLITKEGGRGSGGQELMLGTNPEASPLLERITKEELSRDIGKAGLETLTIILYKGPIARADIDYIRGVNSSYILRNLMIRGLVERIANPADARGFLYQPTFDLLAHLGITRIEELPEFSSIQDKVDSFVEAREDKKQEHASGE